MRDVREAIVFTVSTQMTIFLQIDRQQFNKKFSDVSHVISTKRNKMAASGGVTQLGGYEYEFLSPVPDKWICLVCQLPLNDPVQVGGCGHRFCRICMDKVMR